MLNILLIPVNDLISHPIETRFISIGKKMIEKFNVNISVLRYPNIPTSSRVERKLGFKPVKFKDLKFENLGLYYLGNSVSIFSTLAHQLKNEEIDVIIHANVIPSAIGVKLGEIFHKPLIFDFQDYFPESAASYFEGNLLKLFTYSVVSRITRFNIKHSDAVVTVTNAHREKVKECDPSKLVKVIPNGVDTNLFRPIPKLEALKKLKMENLDGKTIIIYFGSIDPWLDFNTVFNAVRRLVKKGLDMLIFIVGFCHSKYYLEEVKRAADQARIGERVHFLNPVPQEELVYYINASDVTIVPYRLSLKNQAVPLKVLESLACDRFVCTTKIPEVIDRFKDVVGAYSTEEELERLLSNHSEEKDRISVEKKNEILQDYSWDKIASSYYDLTRQVIHNRA